MQNTVGLAKVFLHSVFKTLCFPRELLVCSEQRVRGRVSELVLVSCSWRVLEWTQFGHWSSLPLDTDRRPWPRPAPWPPAPGPVHARPDNRLHSLNVGNIDMDAKLTALTALSNKSSKVSLKKAIQSYPSQMSKIHFRSAQFPRMKI